MSIDKFLERGLLEKRASSKEEINNLLSIVDRDIKDSEVEGISYDWQFGIAYNAALKLASILVRGAGFRVKGGSHHMNTIAIIPLILGEISRDDSEYLDACRRKRNIVEYDYIGGATESDVGELRGFVMEFRDIVLEWIEENKVI